MTTPRISMPEILSSQAQKEVSHNDALRIIDALLQAGVTDRDLTDPPGSPANGAVYIPAGVATGAWAGQEGKLAQWYASSWYFLTPKDGWSVWIIDEAKRITYQNGSWDVEPAEVSTTSLSNSHLSDFASDPATTTGLTWGYKGGRVRNDNAITDVAAGTLALTAGATNYVELTPAGSIVANTSGFTAGRIPLSVLTTDGSAITASTDKRSWVAAAGSSGGGASIPDFDEDLATTTGLTWGYKAGIIRNNNVITHVAAGTLTLTASATNYAEIDSNGAVSFNTTGFTAGRIPLRQLTTDGSGITESTDKRGWLAFSSGGGAGTFLDLSDTPSSFTGQAGKVAKVKSTEDGLEFGEAGGGAFRGCLVFRNTSQSVPNSSSTLVNFTTESFDTDNIWSSGTPARLIVPSGVSKVRITAGVRFAMNGTGIRGIKIYFSGNSSDTPGVPNNYTYFPAYSGTPQYISITTPIHKVAGGHYFELYVFQDSGGSLMIDGSTVILLTHMMMEIIE